MPNTPLNNLDSDASSSGKEIIVFDTLTIISLLLLVACLLPAYLGTHIQRCKTWYGLLVSWIIYSLSYTLLLGQQRGPGEHVNGVCIFQASIIYAAPVIGAFGAACYIIEVYLMMSISINPDSESEKATSLWGPTRRKTQILILLPGFLFFLITLETILGLLLNALLAVSSVTWIIQSRKKGNSSHASEFYDTKAIIRSIISTTVALLAALVALALQGILFYRNIKLKSSSILPVSPNHFGPSIFIRMAFFTTMLLFGIAIGIYSFNVKSFPLNWSVLLPAAPVLVALAFGTQKQIVRSWMCHREK
ncbi:hypothetical protein BDQ12DRAFT_721867 [Crucibulum laeve]|uniref:Uncharacterized protein n=1 Tax=Crucibulum laeve TaxID=68775 RepID=A0A5C3M4U5_9AGAR|nr:hypothetical protein BDQ12DRAFT_721867 [Crucibulum laeve]